MIYGAGKSERPIKNLKVIENFTSQITILPIFNAIKIYAKEKLKKQRKIISDFDILISSTSIANKMKMVTRNVGEFERLKNIKIENWIEN